MGGGSLGRAMLEDISPMVWDEDAIHDAVNEAEFMLRAYARRLPSDTGQ
jgi:hypothetical protein